jgi:hypothetical protein
LFYIDYLSYYLFIALIFNINLVYLLSLSLFIFNFVVIIHFHLYSLLFLLIANLICSYNNVIFILNFICLLFLFIFILFVFNLINMALFILLIYATLINLLFLVNGLLLISSCSYIYYSISSYLVINNLNLDISYYIGINHYHNAIIYISIIHFCNLCYLSSYSTLLNIGLNRLGNLIFDNSLFCLLWLIFFINLINLNTIFNIPIQLHI